jgi:hypothetical protein
MMLVTYYIHFVSVILNAVRLFTSNSLIRRFVKCLERLPAAGARRKILHARETDVDSA